MVLMQQSEDVKSCFPDRITQIVWIVDLLII